MADLENNILRELISRQGCASFKTLFGGTTPMCVECLVRVECIAPDKTVQYEMLEIALEGTVFSGFNPAIHVIDFDEPVISIASPRPIRVKKLGTDEEIVVVRGYSLTRAGKNVVSCHDVLDSAQYQMRARNVEWPSEFVMEDGKDLRKSTANVENRDRRHQIDWYRPGSYVEPMPNIDMWRCGRNPYEGSVGKASAIALATYTCLKDRGVILYGEAMAEDICTAASSMPTTYNKTAVRDALRDMALFGICERFLAGYYAIPE